MSHHGPHQGSHHVPRHVRPPGSPTSGHTPGRPPGGPVPRARYDPIRTPEAALAVVGVARSWPPRPEIIAVVLDDAGCGTGAIYAVTDVVAADDVLRVIDHVGLHLALDVSAGAVPDALVVASIRLAESSVLDDIDLWQCASDLADAHGLTLREWFVISPAGTMCPRELLGEPDRWPRP